MINEFDLKNYEPLYKDYKITEYDYILCFKDGFVYLKDDLSIPLYKDLGKEVDARYLFSLNGKKYFFTFNEIESEYQKINIYRTLEKPLGFLVMTAYHLYLWYKRSNYCGCCGEKLVHSLKERMFLCPNCNTMFFPKISPFVIVMVYDKKSDSIVVTKYKSGYSKFALIAGFVEIGESVEDAVKREVFEEVGIKVKNIKYYSSQPWGISGGLALGYTCEVDGNLEINLDLNELSEAKMLKRYDSSIEVSDEMSLTGTMIKAFKSGLL